MRYLNKIVFINSAHVPYAEIKLDGNVHFIGTQGVGKSTLLRAILFFYNVDKSKLGIRTQDKQKSYDEFYLPHPNSYIIYEVYRETGSFFVVTFLSRGRTAFRIVDCPYDKRFFIDEENNARYEWGRISEQIGVKVFKSSIIRGYEEFRDVIYGNHQNVAKELRRFCIVESSKYQNVPRTIQNIFLNQSLESRVIKDTIIDSMDFAGDGIDLNFYREHVKNFRQQYDDIWKWYKTEKNGKVKVKCDADKVIERYTQYENTRKTISELCSYLNYALVRDIKRLPQLAEEEIFCSNELSRQKRLLGEEEDKYNAEYGKLKQDEGGLKSFLEEVNRRRQHYESIGIGRIAERVGLKGELKVQQQSLIRQEEMVTSKNQSVKQKYDALLQESDTQLREYKLQAERRINEIEREQNESSSRLQMELNLKQENVRLQFQQKLDETQKRLDDARQTKSELEIEMQRVKHANPYQEQIDEQERKVKEAQERLHQLSLESSGKQREIDHITNEVTIQRKELETVCEKAISGMENEIKPLAAEIQKCDNLLSRQKGSLIEWLGENVEGWEDKIGIVLDEDAVLYNTSLNPRLEEKTDTVYGIRIDTENIDRTIKTPEAVKEERERLALKVTALRNRIVECRQQLESDINELERKPNAQLKQLRMEIINIDAERNLLPARIERIQKDKTSIEESLAEWRKSELDKLQQKSGDEVNVIETLKQQKRSLNAQREKELDSLRKSFDRQNKVVSDESEQKKASIESQLSQNELSIVRHKGELQAQMDAELKGLGVDVSQLAKIRKQLQAVNEELEYINNNRREYERWLDDTKEYFEQEQRKKDERKAIRQKIDDLKEKFEKRRQHYNEGVAKFSSELRSLQEEQKSLETAVKRANDFKMNSSCPVELLDAGECETSKPLAEILDELRDTISQRQRKMEEFKQAVTAFKGNFSPQNTFHFRTEFNSDDDYTEFAADLNEFISNKKIEEYRVRTSNQYATIIKRVAKEVSDISQHKSDIEKTINEINRDFRENNFAGVIKEIELRAVESNDRLMQQLLNIKRFDDEYSYDIGQLNLFSNEDNLDQTNEQAVKLLMTLIDLMDVEQKRDHITLSDTFKLEFKVKENDNDTNWVEKLSNVGSDGTDILVKAMVNIMLINVFKRKISKKFGDFKLHCMMDEIGKLHPNNVEGILKFANVRNIFLINSSPTTYNAQAYRYTYALSKDERSNTVVKTLLTIR